MAHRLVGYQPRTAEHSVLYRVIDGQLETFLDTVAHHTDGHRLPQFVEQEFRDFLTCGVLEHGFARLRCGDCAFERLVPFSCKGRGFCPSCGGRRMTEAAARLVDGILPHVPVRQWVLSLPHLVIQRFGGGLNLNIHFHTLVLDGVFTEGGGGTLPFRPLPPPTDGEVGAVLATIYVRVCRLLRRQGFDETAADLSRPDPIAEKSPMLAGISSASIHGRVALGPRAGRRVWRMGDEPDAPWVLSSHPRHAHIAGFDLHADVAVPAADRARLEQLCRYLLRPPVAQDRLRRMGDDRILLTLKTPWADGTRHLLFAPMELLEKLAALTPRPRINLILYHGVLAPHASWRARTVACGTVPGPAATALNLEGNSDDDRGRHHRAGRELEEAEGGAEGGAAAVGIGSSLLPERSSG